MPRKRARNPFPSRSEIEVRNGRFGAHGQRIVRPLGVEPAFDYRRVEWSRWFRCADSCSLVLMSSKPGIFALGEEIVAPAAGGKRMLGLFQVSETDDLGMALGRMFLPGSPLRERLAGVAASPATP